VSQKLLVKDNYLLLNNSSDTYLLTFHGDSWHVSECDAARHEHTDKYWANEV